MGVEEGQRGKGMVMACQRYAGVEGKAPWVGVAGDWLVASKEQTGQLTK